MRKLFGLFKKADNKKGEGYIDVVIGLMCLFMVVVLTMNIYNVMILKQDLDTIADQIITISAKEGNFGSTATQKRIDTLKNDFFDFNVEFDAPDGWYGDEMNDYRVDYGDTMKVTVSTRATLDGVGIFIIPFEARSSRTNVSAKHWRENIDEESVPTEPDSGEEIGGDSGEPEIGGDEI